MGQSTKYNVPPELEPACKKQRNQHHKNSLQPTIGVVISLVTVFDP